MSHHNGNYSQEPDGSGDASSLPAHSVLSHRTPTQMNPRASRFYPRQDPQQAADSNSRSCIFSEPVSSSSPAPSHPESSARSAPSHFAPPHESSFYPLAAIPRVPFIDVASVPEQSTTLVVMYRNSHFFLTVALFIKLDELKAKISEKLRSLGPDQNIGDIIPARAAIESLVVRWNAMERFNTPYRSMISAPTGNLFMFPLRTILNDENIEGVLLFMEEKKTGYEILLVDTGEEILAQTQDMEEDKKKSGRFVG